MSACRARRGARAGMPASMAFLAARVRPSARDRQERAVHGGGDHGIRSRRLPDGNRIVRKSTTLLARDGAGRTRQERKDGGRAGVYIFDPIDGRSIVLNDRARTWTAIPPDARRRRCRRPPAPPPPPRPDAAARRSRSSPGASSSAPQRRGRRRRRARRGRPHRRGEHAAMPPPPLPPLTLPIVPRGKGETKSLGTREFDGIKAEGTMTSHTIPAGQIGNERPIVITSERWFSPGAAHRRLREDQRSARRRHDLPPRQREARRAAGRALQGAGRLSHAAKAASRSCSAVRRVGRWRRVKCRGDRRHRLARRPHRRAPAADAMHALRLRRLPPVRGAPSPRGDADINRCPPGGDAVVVALAALTGRAPQAARSRVRRRRARSRVAVIDEAACIGCTLCIEACPVDAIVGARQAHARRPAVAVHRLRALRRALPGRLHRDGAGRTATGRATMPTPRALRHRARNARLARNERIANRKRRAAAPTPSASSAQAAVAAALARARARRAAQAVADGAACRRSLHCSPLHVAMTPPPRHATSPAQLDALWNFGKPAESEARFRAELAKHPPARAKRSRSRRRSRARKACSASSPTPTRRSTRVAPSSIARPRACGSAISSSAAARATRAATRSAAVPLFQRGARRVRARHAARRRLLSRRRAAHARASPRRRRSGSTGT